MQMDNTENNLLRACSSNPDSGVGRGGLGYPTTDQICRGRAAGEEEEYPVKKRLVGFTFHDRTDTLGHSQQKVSLYNS